MGTSHCAHPPCCEGECEDHIDERVDDHVLCSSEDAFPTCCKSLLGGMLCRAYCCCDRSIAHHVGRVRIVSRGTRSTRHGVRQIHAQDEEGGEVYDKRSELSKENPEVMEIQSFLFIFLTHPALKSSISSSFSCVQEQTHPCTRWNKEILISCDRPNKSQNQAKQPNRNNTSREYPHGNLLPNHQVDESVYSNC